MCDNCDVQDRVTTAIQRGEQRRCNIVPLQCDQPSEIENLFLDLKSFIRTTIGNELGAGDMSKKLCEELVTYVTDTQNIAYTRAEEMRQACETLRSIATGRRHTIETIERLVEGAG